MAREVKNKKEEENINPDIAPREQEVIPEQVYTEADPAPEPLPSSEQVAPTPSEVPVEVEQPMESITIKEEGTIDKAIDGLKKKLKKPKKIKPTQIPQVRDELTIQEEKIMEEGLKDAFGAMTPIQKQEFKIKGEETALQIRQLLKSTRVKIKNIFKLLFEWLRLLPGINKFFLEQEAKIKSERIMSLKDFNKK